MKLAAVRAKKSASTAARQAQLRDNTVIDLRNGQSTISGTGLTSHHYAEPRRTLTSPTSSAQS